MTSPVSPNASVLLPPLIAGYVEATNSFDLERLMATFAEDALVNDSFGTIGESRPSENGRSAISLAND
jgi:hypothetical protein